MKKILVVYALMVIAITAVVGLTASGQSFESLDSVLAEQIVALELRVETLEAEVLGE